MNINYTENKTPTDIFPLREEPSDNNMSFSKNIKQNIPKNSDFFGNLLGKKSFSDILNDKENTIILILILILMKNHSNKNLVLALCYLLI